MKFSRPVRRAPVPIEPVVVERAAPKRKPSPAQLTRKRHHVWMTVEEKAAFTLVCAMAHTTKQAVMNLLLDDWTAGRLVIDIPKVAPTDADGPLDRIILNRSPADLHEQKVKAVAVGAAMSDVTRALIRYYIAQHAAG
ncbi:hypothetical protein [Burkholderia glumae]|uniref:hypothetical protein n=1 Tax=Burkholderia glumae TaxID=337 RepID=UPI00214FC958|nr:hypothetical protein [Burkholderia glumae]